MRTPISELKFDYNLYPRPSLDGQSIGYMVEALATGVKFPAIIVDKRSRRITDGFHRSKAFLRYYGEKAEIDCEFVTYQDDAAMFMDAMRRNNHHGIRLDTHDKVHCWTIASRLGISSEKVAKALSMPFARFEELIKERVAFYGKSNQPIVLKATVRHMHGEKLTESQKKVNEKLGGMQQLFYVNQLCMLLETDMLDKDNENLMKGLKKLSKLIGEVI